MERVELPELEYGYDEIEPVIDRRIMELHHSIHHKGYVNGANRAMDELDKWMETGEGDVRRILRNLSFHMNGHMLHSVFWKVLRKPEDGNEPYGRALEMIEKNFGSFEKFRRLFTSAAVSVEGSGWAVLAKHGENLAVMGIEKHNLNHLAGFRPVLAIDVWEHAYYLQYENRRREYVENFWRAVDWENVNAMMRA